MDGRVVSSIQPGKGQPIIMDHQQVTDSSVSTEIYFILQLMKMQINDGEWHKLEMSISGSKAILEVDGRRVETNLPSGIRTSKKSAYFQ